MADFRDFRPMLGRAPSPPFLRLLSALRRSRAVRAMSRVAGGVYQKLTDFRLTRGWTRGHRRHTMMPTDRLREELTRAKATARTMQSSRAAEDLRHYIDRIERRLSARG